MVVQVRDVVRECKMRGLSLRADAARSMQEFVSQSGLEAGVALRMLVDAVRVRMERGEGTKSVDVAVVRSAMAEVRKLDEEEEDEWPGSAVVLEAWATPALDFDSSSKRFALREVNGRHVVLTAESRTMSYRARYEMAWQRVSRNPMFKARNDGQAIELNRLDACSGKDPGSRVCVIGMLSEDGEGRCWLEDPYSRVRVTFSDSTTSFGGYFGRGMCVVVEGVVDRDASLNAACIGHPPPETRADAERAAGGPHFDVFSRLPGAFSADARDGSPWIVVAEPHLDASNVLPRLRAVLDGLIVPNARAYKRAALAAAAERPPPRPTLVLLGDFVSPGLTGSKAVRELRSRFADLGTLLCAPEYDDLPLCDYVDFVLIPGPRDPPGSGILPRPSLPKFVVKPLLDKLHAKGSPRLTLATSPCRLRAANGNEIVFHRHDNLKKLRRTSSRLLPNEDDSLPAEYLAKTLLDQGHLAPLSLELNPVHPDFDHALRLYPPPHALAIADDTAPSFQLVYDDCAVFNPGSFVKDGTFALFDPISKRVDSSQVP